MQDWSSRFCFSAPSREVVDGIATRVVPGKWVFVRLAPGCGKQPTGQRYG
jgi:hypothetical protein